MPEEGIAKQTCPCIFCEPSDPDMFSLDPKCPQPKVIVIGAGIAGLSAAHRLVKAGLRSVTVLEALDRPGGRIHTVNVGNGIAELGAGLIVGACMSNPVFSLACQAGVVDEPLIRNPRYGGYCFISSGKFVPSRVRHAAALLFDDITEKAKKMMGKSSTDWSLWKFFDKELKEQVKLFPRHDQGLARSVLYGFTNEIRSFLGADLKNIPLSRFGYWKEIPGGNIEPRGGFKEVLEPLLKDTPASSIKYKKPVKSIQWRPMSPDYPRVRVETCDGEFFYGDYVIITLPLGVLKEQHEDLFVPKLPPSKIETIRKIKFGNVNNICLYYEKPFWLPNEGCMQYSWNKHELEDLNDWKKCIGKIEDMTNSKNILTTTIAGQSAENVEYLTECELSIEMTKLLRCFLNDPTIPQPNAVLRSRWSTNQFFRGGITYLNNESVENDQYELARPIPDKTEDKAPVVFFAGEACSPGYQGTTHGARLSGIQQAEHILNLTKCYCGPPPKLRPCLKAV